MTGTDSITLFCLMNNGLYNACVIRGTVCQVFQTLEDDRLTAEGDVYLFFNKYRSDYPYISPSEYEGMGDDGQEKHFTLRPRKDVVAFGEYETGKYTSANLPAAEEIKRTVVFGSNRKNLYFEL